MNPGTRGWGDNEQDNEERDARQWGKQYMSKHIPTQCRNEWAVCWDSRKAHLRAYSQSHPYSTWPIIPDFGPDLWSLLEAPKVVSAHRCQSTFSLWETYTDIKPLSSVGLWEQPCRREPHYKPQTNLEQTTDLTHWLSDTSSPNMTNCVKYGASVCLPLTRPGKGFLYQTWVAGSTYKYSMGTGSAAGETMDMGYNK